MNTGPSGLMHEQTFNELLAEALRTRRRSWRDNESSVIAERHNVFTNDPGLRPDILIKPPEIYPVVIEVEFGEPAFVDARHRLGREVSGTTDAVRSAIAVGAPSEIRNWSVDQLRENLGRPRGLELKCAILSADIEGPETHAAVQDTDVSYWPPYPYYITGTVDDLAVLCEYAAAPPGLVARTADQVSNQIHSLAHSLYSGLGPDLAREISKILGQHDQRQALRMACCIWLTSLRLHNLLAAQSDSLRKRGLRSVAELRTAGQGIITLGDIRAEWDKILDVNYGSIFSTARAALHDQIPDAVGANTMDYLSQLAERVTALRLGNRVDFAGELFPRLLEDREETAAHYTLPETADLLAHLAVDRMQTDNWASAEAVAALKIADLSCGTGALLRAAYHRIRRVHEAAGGTSEDLHRAMMEHSITGLDINSLASHMTAAGLSTTEIETEYHTAHIAAVAVIGGKTGSLELLEEQQMTDVLGEMAVTATARTAEPTNIPLQDGSQDLIIQNPPYSRARGKRKLFDVTGITEAQRKRSIRRLASIRGRLREGGNEVIDGQAGLGADFSALADMKLKDGGIFATVLPLTAAHAESWEGFRRTIERKYRRIIAIAFAEHEGAMMSADTYMNEMLLIATKRTEQEMCSRGVVLSVNLRLSPSSGVEAFWFANLLAGIKLSGRNTGVIHDAGMRIGSWTLVRTPRPGFPWFSLGMQNHHVAAVAAELMFGHLYSPHRLQRWELDLPMTTLDRVVSLGPTHDLIGHPRGGDGRGAFTFDEVEPGASTTYPSLWGARGGRQKTIMTMPTHDGEPAVTNDDALQHMLTQQSDLFISRNLRMTSQALAAARTPEIAMGGRAWTALMCDNEAVKAALSIWCNSTLGLLLRTCYAQTTQQGRATMQVKALAGFPVPDFTSTGESGERARTAASRHFDSLKDLSLEPASYAFRDENRARIDGAALELLGLGDNSEAADSVATLRSEWCREPSVHGGTRGIMRAQGLLC